MDFVSSIPRTTTAGRFSPEEPLFNPVPPGSATDHFIVQAGMLLGGGREGGFFTMIGRKRA